MSTRTKRKRSNVHVLFWTCVFPDNVTTQGITARTCANRHQSDSYFFSLDRQSHVRFLHLVAPGMKAVQVRSATTGHLDSIRSVFEPWAVPYRAGQLIATTLPDVLAEVTLVVASFAITPMLFLEDELVHQQTALRTWSTWLSCLECPGSGPSYQRRMRSDHRNGFMCQTDFHAMDLCFNTDLHTYWATMDVPLFSRDAIMVQETRTSGLILLNQSPYYPLACIDLKSNSVSVVRPS